METFLLYWKQLLKSKFIQKKEFVNQEIYFKLFVNIKLYYINY
jgi:hypothetical protein